jgi:hypothetical protein
VLLNPISGRGFLPRVRPPLTTVHCLLQELGHFLLHTVGLCQRTMPVWLKISYFDMFDVAAA